MAAPTVTNPGVMNINKAHWKHKMTQFIGGSNPGVGMGAPYMLTAATVKGIGDMNLCFVYGVQHLPSEVAQRVTDKLEQKLRLVGGTFQSKI